MNTDMAITSQFFRELRHRGVFGTAAIYIVAAWVLIQVASEAFPGFNIPEYAIRYVWFGVVLGFPLALVVGWMYDISTRGIRRTQPAINDDQPEASLGRLDYLLLSSIGLIGLGIVVILTGKILALQDAFPTPGVVREIAPNSVAVLPLDNFTGDPDQKYVVAALHEALTAGLTGISALKVISRTSASAFAGSDKTLPEIGRALGVANIIEGSVFRSGDRVRITLQLIDTKTDQHLWAENFEREMADLLALHGEVARAVAQQIGVVLKPEEDNRLNLDREVNPETLQLYLKGMYFITRQTPEGIRKGLPYLQQAVERDPGNARAYAGLALGYNTIGHGIGRGAFPKALAAARRALELDKFSGEAWAALAEAQVYYEYDFAEADRSYRRAIQLAPSLDHAHAHYAYLLALLGRPDEEILYHAYKAIELSPLDPSWPAFASWPHTLRGEFDKAEELLNDSLELAHDNPFALMLLGELRRIQGRLEEAIEIQERIPVGHPMRNWALGPTYAVAGRSEDALLAISRMTDNPGPKDKLFTAFTCAALGDFDQAMHWFEIAYETRTDWLPWIALDTEWGGMKAGIRDDPRFQALVDRLNIPPSSE